jgi:hypothetical protein
MNVKQRLERLELFAGGDKAIEKKHFTNGICDEAADCSNPTVFTDKQGEPLNGWHYVSTTMLLGFDIV